MTGVLVAGRLFYVRSRLVIFPGWLLFEAGRQCGVDSATVAYADWWIKTEPVFLVLLIAAAFEAYIRVAMLYRKGIRSILIVGGVVVLLGALAAIALGLPAQAGIDWQRIPLRNLMWSHQLVYFAVALSMGLATAVFRLAPAGGVACGLLWHTRLLCLLALIEATIMLLVNRRVIMGEAVQIVTYVGTTLVLACWFLLKDWQSTVVETRDVMDQLQHLQ